MCIAVKAAISRTSSGRLFLGTGSLPPVRHIFSLPLSAHSVPTAIDDTIRIRPSETISTRLTDSQRQGATGKIVVCRAPGRQPGREPGREPGRTKCRSPCAKWCEDHGVRNEMQITVCRTSLSAKTAKVFCQTEACSITEIVLGRPYCRDTAEINTENGTPSLMYLMYLM